MSARNLEIEIKSRIENATEGMHLLNIKGEYVPPLVETGVLPKESVKGNPYILIQTTKISDEETESQVEITILYGTVGIGQNTAVDKEAIKHTHATGHWDIISVIDRIRENFLKNTSFNVGMLDRNMKHEVFGQVDFPYYLGESKLNFTLPTTEHEDDYL